jgi:hypothetical protein
MQAMAEPNRRRTTQQRGKEGQNREDNQHGEGDETLSGSGGAQLPVTL